MPFSFLSVTESTQDRSVHSLTVDVSLPVPDLWKRLFQASETTQGRIFRGMAALCVRVRAVR